MINHTGHFDSFKIVADIKKEYHRLAMIYHPDRGGNLQVMQEVNSQYDRALKAANGQVSDGDDGREHTYKYDAEAEAAIVDFIDRLIHSGVLNQGCEAYIIGTWVWIIGDTKPLAKTLGKDGIKAQFHAVRQCWYFTPKPGRYYSKTGLDGLAAKYGASRVAAGKRRDEISD